MSFAFWYPRLILKILIIWMSNQLDITPTRLVLLQQSIGVL